jgi:hypothetical protein
MIINPNQKKKLAQKKRKLNQKEFQEKNQWFQ